MSPLLDSLAHLDDPRITNADALLKRAAAAGVVGVINGGVDPFEESLEWTPPPGGGVQVWRAFGIHPLAVGRHTLARHLEELTRFLDEGQAVALGEIGLDARDGFAAMELQESFLEAQLEVAAKRRLPVILHCVQATERLLGILRRWGIPPAGGVVHGFSGSPETARAFCSMGYHLSFGGLVTRSNARRCRAAAAALPLNRLLIESDCPDHPPVNAPHSYSEPASILLTAQELASIRGESLEVLGEAVAANTRALFGLPAGS
ncbi:MAG: TatD family hydrolase [Myxococcota bacterium]|nr:TatD family hydrolase [Myxococcota bacterium]